jgi:hypothetical protein
VLFGTRRVGTNAIHHARSAVGDLTVPTGNFLGFGRFGEQVVGHLYYGDLQVGALPRSRGGAARDLRQRREAPHPRASYREARTVASARARRPSSRRRYVEYDTFAGITPALPQSTGSSARARRCSRCAPTSCSAAERGRRGGLAGRSASSRATAARRSRARGSSRSRGRSRPTRGSATSSSRDFYFGTAAAYPTSSACSRARRSARRRSWAAPRRHGGRAPRAPRREPDRAAVEILTDDDWGAAVAPWDLHPSWAAAAATCKAEGLGCSFLLERAEPAEGTIDALLALADGARYLDPLTGLLAVRLARGPEDPTWGYTPGTTVFGEGQIRDVRWEEATTTRSPMR